MDDVKQANAVEESRRIGWNENENENELLRSAARTMTPAKEKEKVVVRYWSKRSRNTCGTRRWRHIWQ